MHCWEIADSWIWYLLCWTDISGQRREDTMSYCLQDRGFPQGWHWKSFQKEFKPLPIYLLYLLESLEVRFSADAYLYEKSQRGKLSMTSDSQGIWQNLIGTISGVYRWQKARSYRKKLTLRDWRRKNWRGNWRGTGRLWGKIYWWFWLSVRASSDTWPFLFLSKSDAHYCSEHVDQAMGRFQYQNWSCEGNFWRAE